MMWIESLLHEIKNSIPICPTIWCDNLSIVAFSANLVFHARTKHIELNLHFMCDRVLASKLLMFHIPIIEKLVDILTKPLLISQFHYLHSKLSVINIPLSLRGDDTSVTISDVE